MDFTICLSRGKNWFARMICWVSKSEVSHAVIVFDSDAFGTRMVLEAMKRGLVITPWEKWKKKNMVVAQYKVCVPERLLRKSFQDVGSYIGVKYGKVVRLFVNQLILRREPASKNPFERSTEMFCSEVVVRFLHRTGDPRFKHFNDYGNWWPEKLKLALEASPLIIPVKED